jgi:type VI secretion system protein ImpH
MILTFMGLYGVDSPLPAHFSDIIASISEADAEEEKVDHKDTENPIRALRDFLDIFDHRVYSLFYRAWKKYRYYLQFEAGADDRFSQYMLSLMGLGTPALQDLVGVEVARLVAYTGIAGQQARCAEGLQNLLSDYFGGIGAKVVKFMPRWVDIPDQYRTRLGATGMRLGENVTIGGRIRDFTGKFRVVLGPLKLKAFRRFLPGGIDSQGLERLVRFYAPDQLAFDVKLLLRKEEVPPIQLGENLAQLGWTTWLKKPSENVVSIVFAFDCRGG